MKIYQQIRLFYIISGLSMAVLVTFGLLFMERSRDQVQYIDEVEHAYKVLSSINFCEKMLIETEAAQRGYLLTSDTTYLDIFKFNLPQIDSSLKAIGGLTLTNDNQKTFYLQLTKFVVTRVAVLEQNLQLQRTDPLYFENLRNGTVAMDNCRFYMKKMRGVEENQLRDGLAKKNKYQQLNQSFFKTTFITSCLICMVAIVIFFRELGIRLTTQRTLRSKINELSNSKQELEEITFAASHDLQEPMRKVRILSNLAIKKFAHKIHDEDLEIIHRVNKITEQMHGLLNDLVLYTNLLNSQKKYGEVDLYEVFKDAYYKVFRNEEAEFKILSKLPVIYGSHTQIETMFIRILENSLKFKTPENAVIITVNYELKPVKESKYFWDHLSAKQFHQVTVTDNGIGFDKQYSEKIFGLFQRLHTQAEYPGKGIGLSIARRVMTNHKGYISATSERQAGASFILYFPNSTR